MATISLWGSLFLLRGIWGWLLSLLIPVIIILMLLMIAPAAAAKLLQLCPTLCDPIDSSPSGSPVPGILQARILEWVAISNA